MKVRGFLSIILYMVGLNTALAQSAVKTDLTLGFATSAVWRGITQGSAALQPEFTLGWKGLDFSAWSSVGLFDNVREIDLTLSYTIGNLQLSVVDYWGNTDTSLYFDYNSHTTGHAFEGAIAYNFGPVSASWQTFFAGQDYLVADGKRAFSSYLEISAPFKFGGLDWEATMGVVPWASDFYETNGFHFTNISLKAEKTIPICDRFSLPLYGRIIANPSNRKLYFVAGFTL